MMGMRRKLAIWAAGVALIGAVSACNMLPQGNSSAEAGLLDGNSGGNWTGYGNTYGEQHFSPLTEVNVDNIGKLGLAWSYDLPAGNPVSTPIAIDGVLYTATGYSVVRAFDAQTGKLLWEQDLKGADNAGLRLRQSWGIRGLAWWNGKVIVGVQDGRLVALDGKSGKQVWSVMTLDENSPAFITGAPRVFDGKVIIGNGGSDSAPLRGFVTTYDAETGKKLWRFYLVPGKPGTKDGEVSDPTMEMAAGTWSGEWWKFGGGGTAWNSFTYDKETDTILVGTGNGAPYNPRIRSPEGGDNLFLCAMVALDAKTGKYKWHYQFNPGEAWDYNAAMDMQLADLVIDGKLRKVVMEAPKNGFFYVIDRTNGKLISAEPFVKTSWATGIDLKTGRPIETPDARYPDGKDFVLTPGINGAHTSAASAFNRVTKLMYMPVTEIAYTFNDRGVDVKNWKFGPHNIYEAGVNIDIASESKGRLIAIDPVTQKKRWQVQLPSVMNGGVLTTGGNLVFQGDGAGHFSAYDARSGAKIWSFNAGVPVFGGPISYSAGGKQYVTVLAGSGTVTGLIRSRLGINADYRTQQRRVLTFVLDGKATLPVAAVPEVPFVEDPTYSPDPASAARGATLFGARCFACHGPAGSAGGTAPDFARSSVPQSADAFRQIVHGGMLKSQGMPQFGELSDRDLADLRQFIRAESAAARAKR